MKTIGFIGFGLIGGSIAKAIRQAHPHWFLGAFSRTKASLEDALSDHTIDAIWERVDSVFSSPVSSSSIDIMRSFFFL